MIHAFLALSAATVSRVRARARCSELRNPGIHAEPGPRRWRVACVSTRDRPLPLLCHDWADVPLCSSTTSTPAVAVAHVINRGFLLRLAYFTSCLHHDVPFYRIADNRIFPRYTTTNCVIKCYNKRYGMLKNGYSDSNTRNVTCLRPKHRLLHNA